MCVLALVLERTPAEPLGGSVSGLKLDPYVCSGVRTRTRTAVSLVDGNGGGSEGARCSPLRSGSDTSAVSLALGTAVVATGARCSPLRSGSGTTTVSLVDGNRGDSKRWVGTYVATWNPLLRSVARDRARTCLPTRGSGSGLRLDPSVLDSARKQRAPPSPWNWERRW